MTTSPSVLARPARLQASFALASDSITVRNLSVRVNAGYDVWGRQKEQRALVTVSVILKSTFDSAAAADTLDTSTIHYGHLSKNISSRIQEVTAQWTSTYDLSQVILHAVTQTAGNAPIAGTHLEIFYPKGSMLGDGAGSTYSYFEGSGSRLLSRVLLLSNVQIPCLIGVNSNERMKKQPVVVSLWIECISENRVDDYVEVEECLTRVSLRWISF
jgi:dihydroneopterin aldolase